MSAVITPPVAAGDVDAALPRVLAGTATADAGRHTFGGIRVVVVSLNYAPEPTGVGRYSGELVQALAARGNEVRVICAPPHYPHWRVAKGYSAWRWSTEYPSPRVTVMRCPLWVPRRAPAVARLLHMASFAASSLVAMVQAAFWRPQLVMVVAPAMFSTPGAWALARCSGARAWLHVQDFEVDAAFALNMLRGKRLQGLVAAAESWWLRRFDRVTTISTRMHARLLAKGVAAERTALLPNAVDTRAVRPLDAVSPLRAAWGISSGTIVCLFTGTMNRKQDLHLLIEAAQRLLASPQLLFLICGQGEMREMLEVAAAEVPNVRIADLQPAERFNDLLNLADIHLLPQAADVADLVMPSKLGGMLASGRPVVATAAQGTEIASVVGECGIVVAPGDAQALAAAVLVLAADADRRKRLGAAARRYAQRELDALHVHDRLDDTVRGLVRIRKAPKGKARSL